jgi:hypothetical protein
MVRSPSPLSCPPDGPSLRCPTGPPGAAPARPSDSSDQDGPAGVADGAGTADPAGDADGAGSADPAGEAGEPALAAAPAAPGQLAGDDEPAVTDEPAVEAVCDVEAAGADGASTAGLDASGTPDSARLPERSTFGTNLGRGPVSGSYLFGPLAPFRSGSRVVIVGLCAIDPDGLIAAVGSTVAMSAGSPSSDDSVTSSGALANSGRKDPEGLSTPGALPTVGGVVLPAAAAVSAGSGEPVSPRSLAEPPVPSAG